MRALAIRRLAPLTSSIALVLTLGGAAPPPSPADYTVVGMDYAFKLPSDIRAGTKTFAFENHGTVRHEFVVAKLHGDVSADSLATLLRQGTLMRQLVEGQVALIVSAPNEATSARLLLDLERGRTYVAYCQLQDAPDKPRHLMLGMFGTFVPK